jgi:DNA segregation ATPase FtsK/SpoIIIE, S-DNA-T family
MSLDRKLDILGIGLALFGMLTLLSLLSISNSIATGSLLELVGRATGRGAFLFPISLILLGLWLVLRNFERVPLLSMERLTGLVLLYINSPGGTALLQLPRDAPSCLCQLAQEARGGGYIGAAIWIGCAPISGWGARVALVAWLLIALALALDVSVAGLFGWLPPLFVRLQDLLDDCASRQAAPPAPTQGGQPYTPPMPLDASQPSVSLGRAVGPVTTPFPANFKRGAQAWVATRCGRYPGPGR